MKQTWAAWKLHIEYSWLPTSLWFPRSLTSPKPHINPQLKWHQSKVSGMVTMGRWISGFAEGSHNFSWRTEGSNCQTLVFSSPTSSRQPGRRAYPPVWCVASSYFPRHHLMQRSQCHGPSLLKHLGTDHCIPLWLSNGVSVTDSTQPRWVYSAATPVKLQHLAWNQTTCWYAPFDVIKQLYTP